MDLIFLTNNTLKAEGSFYDFDNASITPSGVVCTVYTKDKQEQQHVIPALDVVTNTFTCFFTIPQEGRYVIEMKGTHNAMPVVARTRCSVVFS